jgi:hypothetical protein
VVEVTDENSPATQAQGIYRVIKPGRGNGAFSTALKSDGTLWIWGQFGSLTQYVPMQISTGDHWAALSAGAYNLAMLQSDGTLWTMNTLSDAAYPIRIGGDIVWRAVAIGAYHFVALRGDGSLWTWCYNSYGQLGIGPTNNEIIRPVRVGIDTDWSGVAATGHGTLAVKADGSLWAWGGINNTNRPTRIGADSDWVAVAGSADDSELGTAFAVKRDGPMFRGLPTLQSRFSRHHLDLCRRKRREPHRVRPLGGLWTLPSRGLSASEPSPIQIGIDYDWSRATLGNVHALGLKKNGDLWSWGASYSGQLGNGTSGPGGIRTRAHCRQRQLDECVCGGIPLTRFAVRRQVVGVGLQLLRPIGRRHPFQQNGSRASWQRQRLVRHRRRSLFL